MMLDTDTGLLESIHVVFFSNNIVGSEYNYFGPRVSRLGSFLHEKSKKALPRASFRPLLRGEAAQHLDLLTDLRVLELSILPSHVDIVRQSQESLADALAANGRVLENPKVLQVILKPQQVASQGFLSNMVNDLREMVSNSSIREGSDRFQIRVSSNCLEKFLSLLGYYSLGTPISALCTNLKVPHIQKRNGTP